MAAKHDEWETPQALFDALDGVFRFDLDAASNGTNRKCPECYEVTGLEPWWTKFKRVWCNPPYSALPTWVKHCHDQSQLEGRVVAMLIPAYTDTKYWHEVIFKHARQIVFLKGRLKFLENKIERDPARFPSAVVVFGDVEDAGIAVWDWKNEPYPFKGPDAK